MTMTNSVNVMNGGFDSDKLKYGELMTNCKIDFDLFCKFDKLNGGSICQMIKIRQFSR